MYNLQSLPALHADGIDYVQPTESSTNGHASVVIVADVTGEPAELASLQHSLEQVCGVPLDLQSWLYTPW